ncbi:secreted antigen 1 [Babesia caballi]|uniref:Secreted antigen 1 n=1 Tax=Babesia caballi TaxID=5871 RepID=A0AAV4LQE0_BABCB|nr:secreted antigen 1 [Babesia caballi]
MTRCPDVPPPNSLKEALQFAGALSARYPEGSVGQELRRRISEYAGKIAVNNYFTSTLDNLKQLREKLFNNSWNHGSYNNVQNTSPNCLADTVTDWFPKFYCTLSYLNFNVNGDAYGGGQWQHQECSGSNGLSTWLKKGNEIPSASGPSSQAKLWSGGFHGNDIKCRSATEFSSEMGTCVEDNGSKFPMLLSGILFLRPSSPELTSTFVVLVREICVIVTGESEDGERHLHGFESRKALQGKFKSEYGSSPNYGSLKSCCKSLKSNIKTLIGNDSSDGALRIPNSSHELYLGMLNSDKISVYLKWLSQHLGSLIANLQQMHKDCTSWNPNSMSNGQAAGPFPYGFGFPNIGSWNNGQEVQDALSKLTAEGSGGLPALQSHVTILITAYTSSSTGTVAGSLLGTAAVGGAGAAVALNVGGVTTALKGAIGILK